MKTNKKTYQWPKTRPFDMSWALYFFNLLCPRPPVYVVDVVVVAVDVVVVVVVELGVTSEDHRSCANEIITICGLQLFACQ